MAQCPRHPDSLATDLCVECGDCVCGQCAFVTADRRVFCPSCKGLGQSRQPPPVEQIPFVPVSKPRPQPSQARKWPAPDAKARPAAVAKNSKAVIVSIVLPFVCACYGAPFGLGLAIRELVLINGGKSTSSRTLTKASIWINAIVMALLVLVLLVGRK